MSEGTEKVRYGRAQKFRLSARGAEAATSYGLMIEAAKGGTGRAQFDAARAQWGAPLGLVAEDGLFLVEFSGGERTIAEAMRNLEGCGTPPKEVKAAVERLLKLGMLEPLPAAPPPPAPPPRRYW
ncbi:hypothetical protein HPC49_22505 [Pyxidicoccus fallax]|uniref:Uncharacterized protein n=1 Tax=Pyxidicoccus fallax TaxID=394095 RepID=A0A848LLN7_9BACT|nr:hypothetical protein [Pyxidicoccus fallax]NMO18656.1 hypothetical protein [Pyxidicoccus fallax]NPC80986.1 hypothetical protein [Pyxidicoccus fallax]